MGGALGAYEAGVFKALYEKLYRSNEPLFDIVVAGTSIGAVNSCILVNYVVQNRNNWENSWSTLYQFWNELKTPTIWNEFANGWWDYWHNLREAWNRFWKPFIEQNKQLVSWRDLPPFIELYYWWPDKYGPIASGENARRYFSTYYPAKNVLLPPIIQPDMKFFEPRNELNFLWWLRFSNTPLETTIRRYWNDKIHPIRTQVGQPRLLIVGVDIQDATTVTFDSYKKRVDENGNEVRESEYGDEKVRHKIEYPDGVKMEHLRTSMSTHLRYEYPELEVKSGNKTERRQFWDGIYLSNTPLRELLQSHRDYWLDVEGKKDSVPDLEIYIVDLYPTLEKEIPEDADKIVDRELDILFHDKTKYDKKVADMVSDYIGLANDLIELAKNRGATQSDLDRVLNEPALSTSRDGKNRTYQSLLDGRFNISKAVTIELGDYDENDIAWKAFDFSADSIEQLMERGHRDALAKI